MLEIDKTPDRECKLIYIAGPMRGREFYNFPAFDDAKRTLQMMGWDPISPADLDRDAGFDPVKYQEEFFEDIDTEHDYLGEDDAMWEDIPDHPAFDMELCMKRDIKAIMDADAIALLPGWEGSTGAVTEFYLSIWKGIPAFQYPSMEEISLDQTYFAYKNSRKVEAEEKVKAVKDPLIEAIELTGGDRQDSYGNPEEDFARSAGMISSYLGAMVRKEDIPMIMIMIKLSRQKHKAKRDNIVDIAGYARTAWMMQNGLS